VKARCLALLACALGLGCSDAEGRRSDAGDGHSHMQPRDDAGRDAGAPSPNADAGDPPDGSIDGDYRWDLPQGFPPPLVPADNPMSDLKVELGRHLFYDTRLSGNETQSCASCHRQELAFTDGRATGLGSTGESHTRGAMSLANVAYAITLTWANPLVRQLERQASVPLFGDQPIELGLPSIAAIEQRLRDEAVYVEMFAAAFPEHAEPVTAENMNKAIAAFERTLISGRSPFDRFLYQGDQDALSASAKRGYELFNGHPFECFHCHGGFNFSDQTAWAGIDPFEPEFHNTGLYDVDGQGAFPEPNTGVYGVSMKPEDMGRFKAPSLRNIAVTAPYMHDGSIATLSEVLDHYAAGGRTIEEGPYAGDGSKNPRKSPLILGFALDDAQRADLIAFLESLTDEALLSDPRFADPWR
jgi:cytochrome c peroxidase